ncbi:MAG: hypothetical protein ACJAZV_001544 [Roseivirga sp.]|jgi:hypothetical protein
MRTEHLIGDGKNQAYSSLGTKAHTHLSQTLIFNILPFQNQKK